MTLSKGISCQWRARCSRIDKTDFFHLLQNCNKPAQNLIARAHNKKRMQPSLMHMSYHRLHVYSRAYAV